MSGPQAQAMHCILPVCVTRRLPGQAQAMGAADLQITRLLPATQMRVPHPDLRAATLEAAGLVRQLPPAVARDRTLSAAMATGATAGQIHRQLPQPVERAAALDTSAPGELPDAGLARQDNPPTMRARPEGRAHLPVGALLRIVEPVARGISGAAGYAYIGEDPPGAGLRFGALGLRLDTGDMGGAMQLALTRNHRAVEATLGEGAEDVIGAVLADTPQARCEPVDGAALCSPRWKPLLSQTAALDVFRAAQNEYAVEELLRPAFELLSRHPALSSGTALALALDVLAEAGRAAGLAALSAALSGGGQNSVAALRDKLAASVPASGPRLSGLMQDRQLAEWRPDPSGIA